MELTEEFVFSFEMKEPLEAGAGPYGPRIHYELTDGAVRGERLNGRLIRTGGDWMHASPDGFWRPDVRFQMQTDDGALVLVHYWGLVENNEAFARAAEGGEATKYGDNYMRMVFRLETGDERYAWVNQSLFVARGRLIGRLAIEYTVYRVS